MKKNYSKVMLTKMLMQSATIMESSSFNISDRETIDNDTQLGARHGGNTAISDLDLL